MMWGGVGEDGLVSLWNSGYGLKDAFESRICSSQLLIIRRLISGSTNNIQLSTGLDISAVLDRLLRKRWMTYRKHEYHHLV